MFLLQKANISLAYDLGFEIPGIQASFLKYKNSFVVTIVRLVKISFLLHMEFLKTIADTLYKNILKKYFSTFICLYKTQEAKKTMHISTVWLENFVQTTQNS